MNFVPSFCTAFVLYGVPAFLMVRFGSGWAQNLINAVPASVINALQVVGGMDPAEWLIKCAEHLDYVHFKDVNEKVYREVLNEKIRFFDGCGKGAMCPIGKGTLDYPGIKKALEKIGYNGYITIEQERDPRNSDTSLRDVKESVTYLKSVGYEI